MPVTLETGVNWRWYIDTSATGTPSYALLTTQRDGSFAVSPDTVDASYKGAGGWTTKIPTLLSWEGSFSGILDVTDTAFVELQLCATTKKIRKYQLKQEVSPNKTWSVVAYVDLSLKFDQTDVASWEATLIGDGAAVYA